MNCKHEPDGWTGRHTWMQRQAETLDRELRALVDQWYRETGGFSLLEHTVGHPAYLRLIGMGMSALPLLLQ